MKYFCLFYLWVKNCDLQGYIISAYKVYHLQMCKLASAHNPLLSLLCVGRGRRTASRIRQCQYAAASACFGRQHAGWCWGYSRSCLCYSLWKDLSCCFLFVCLLLTSHALSLSTLQLLFIFGRYKVINSDCSRLFSILQLPLLLA
jgi:hypothetical protein